MNKLHRSIRSSTVHDHRPQPSLCYPPASIKSNSIRSRQYHMSACSDTLYGHCSQQDLMSSLEERPGKKTSKQNSLPLWLPKIEQNDSKTKDVTLPKAPHHDLRKMRHVQIDRNCLCRKKRGYTRRKEQAHLTLHPLWTRSSQDIVSTPSHRGSTQDRQCNHNSPWIHVREHSVQSFFRISWQRSHHVATEHDLHA